MEGTLLLPINEDIRKQFALEKHITTPELWKGSYTCYACFWKSQCPSSTFAWCGQQKVLENPARYKLLSKTTMLKVNMKGPSYGCSTIWLGGKLHRIECWTQIWHVVQNKSTLPHITGNLSCHEVQELQRHKKSNSPLLLISVTIVSAYWISSPFPCITVSDWSWNSPRQEGPIRLPLQANK
jgi:hypothetical protein